MTQVNPAELTVEQQEIAPDIYQYLVTGPNTDEVVSAYDNGSLTCTCPRGNVLDTLGRDAPLDDTNCEHKQAVKNSEWGDAL